MAQVGPGSSAFSAPRFSCHFHLYRLLCTRTGGTVASSLSPPLKRLPRDHRRRARCLAKSCTLLHWGTTQEQMRTAQLPLLKPHTRGHPWHNPLLTAPCPAVGFLWTMSRRISRDLNTTSSAQDCVLLTWDLDKTRALGIC